MTPSCLTPGDKIGIVAFAKKGIKKDKIHFFPEIEQENANRLISDRYSFSAPFGYV